MLLEHIFGDDSIRFRATTLLDRDLDLLREHCGSFIEQSHGRPVYKSLEQRKTFVKIKARRQKSANTQYSTVFNEAFNNLAYNLRQRVIYAHGQFNESVNNNGYYIFPINGFKYIYNPMVTNSNVYESAYQHINDDAIISQLLIDNYKDTNLTEAIDSGCEILFFHSPRCYAVNVNSVNSYEDLLTMIDIK